MKKYRFLYILTIVLIGCFLTSCVEQAETIDTSNDDQFTTDIVGKWAKASEVDNASADAQLFYVYLDDGWGYTWDEGDDVTEEFVLNHDYHQNGWFEWSIYNSRITEKNQMRSSDALSTTTYKITQLTSTQLVKYDEVSKVSQRFSRVIK